jgi:hypothetical protein
VTIDEVANCLQINYGSAYEIVHNRLGFHKVYTRWVLKQLTMLYKQTHLDIYQEHLIRSGNERDAFLGIIITGDETWISHCEPDSKQQSMEWKHPQLPSKKRFNHQQENWNIIRRDTKQTIIIAVRCIQTKACNFKQTLMTSVERCCVVA